MIIPIWGLEYINRWLDVTFAALRSEGNLYFLNEHSDFDLVILTMAADVDTIERDKRFNAFTAGIKVKFISMDEFFPPNGKTNYGVPLTLAYAKGILDLGEQAIGTYVILWNADAMIATGSFKSVLDRIRDGYNFIGSPGLRVISERVRDTLYERVNKQDGTLSIEPREMMKLINTNLHGTINARIINEHGPIDTFYFHQLYWRISDNCIAKRGFLIHPLCFQIEKMIEKVLCPMDYGFVSEMCPDGRFCMMDDSDYFLAMELQTQISEEHLLRLTRKGEGINERLSRLAGEISAHAELWTTAEHRRNAKYTIFFHEEDLPDDLSELIAPFDTMIDGILDKLPAPTSHIGHYQWLPALKNYQHDMIDGKGELNIPLLDDPRNELDTSTGSPQESSAIPPETSEITYSPLRLKISRVANKIRDWLSAPELNFQRDQLAEIIKDRLLVDDQGLDIIYLNGIKVGDLITSPLPKVNISNFDIPADLKANDGLFTSLPHTGQSGDIRSVLVYAPVNILSIWHRFSEDAEALLADHRQFILVLIQDKFASLNVTAYSYILSILLSSFSNKKYDYDVDVFFAPKRKPTLTHFFKYMIRNMGVSALRLSGFFRPHSLQVDGEALEHFSALVVSVNSKEPK